MGVLIHTAAGEWGHLALQIAQARGAYVIGTVGMSKHELPREPGADELIDYRSTDFAVVDGTFPLAEVAEAHAHGETGCRTTGRVVLTVRRVPAALPLVVGPLSRAPRRIGSRRAGAAGETVSS